MKDLNQALESQPEAAERVSEENAGGDGAGTQEKEVLQPEEAGKVSLDKELPPELEESRKHLLQDYHEKTQKLAEERKQFEGQWAELKTDSETLKQLAVQPWFKEALEKARNGRSGNVELSDEEFETARNDKAAFTKLVTGLAEKILESKIGPELGAHRKTLQSIEAERQFEAVAQKYPEIKAFKEKGLLDAYLKDGHSYESAYALAKLQHKPSQAEIQLEAEKILAAKKAAAVAKGGTQPAGKAPVFKVKNLDDAIDRAFEMAKKGVSDYSLERA